MSDFNKRLEESVRRRPPKGRRVRATKGRKHIWWRPVHLLTVGLLLAGLVGAGFWGHSWLDGRSVGEGMSDVLDASEAKNGGTKESEFDLGPAPVFESCTKLREVYPAGLAKTGNLRVYDANKRLDVNGNRYLCEDGE